VSDWTEVAAKAPWKPRVLYTLVIVAITADFGSWEAVSIGSGTRCVTERCGSSLEWDQMDRNIRARVRGPGRFWATASRPNGGLLWIMGGLHRPLPAAEAPNGHLGFFNDGRDWYTYLAAKPWPPRAGGAFLHRLPMINCVGRSPGQTATISMTSGRSKCKGGRKGMRVFPRLKSDEGPKRLYMTCQA
jgi:hypothetical protein